MSAILNYRSRPGPKLIDGKCRDLAEHFCADDSRHKAYITPLSEAIQEAVEDFLTHVDYELNEDQR